MKVICDDKLIDLNKFDTVGCRESWIGEGFPVEAKRREAGGLFGAEVITEEICRMKTMENAEKVVKKITESWINEEKSIIVGELIKKL